MKKKNNSGIRVYVYRNLHKNCLSVRDVKSGLVIAHVDSISLKDCKFKVSEVRRQRVIAEESKNVHAGVEGIWIKNARKPNMNSRIRIVYDPYKFDSFVQENTLTRCARSDEAFVTIRGAFVKSFVEKL
jgi:hypothetical protein